MWLLSVCFSCVPYRWAKQTFNLSCSVVLVVASLYNCFSILLIFCAGVVGVKTIINCAVHSRIWGIRVQIIYTGPPQHRERVLNAGIREGKKIYCKISLLNGHCNVYWCEITGATYFCMMYINAPGWPFYTSIFCSPQYYCCTYYNLWIRKK